LWWWQLAGIIEKQQGTQRLTLIFIFSAIISNLTQYFLVGPNFGGLSGVVYSIAGYIWLYGRLNKQSLVNLSDAMFIFLMAWLVLGFIHILPINIANYAHLAGLISGLVIALITTALKLKDL
jgi:GlpG protein